MRSLPTIFLISLVTLIIACGKDKFETKPKLEIKDYSSKDIVQGDVMTIRMNYYDKEGDLSGAPVVGIRRRLNLFPLAPDQDKVDTFSTTLPEFPKKDNGEITFQLQFDFLKESIIENDTLVFRFAVTDLAGNKSDTITTDQIVIHLP